MEIVLVTNDWKVSVEKEEAEVRIVMNAVEEDGNEVMIWENRVPLRTRAGHYTEFHFRGIHLQDGNIVLMYVHVDGSTLYLMNTGTGEILLEQNKNYHRRSMIEPFGKFCFCILTRQDRNLDIFTNKMEFVKTIHMEHQIATMRSFGDKLLSHEYGVGPTSLWSIDNDRLELSLDWEATIPYGFFVNAYHVICLLPEFEIAVLNAYTGQVILKHLVNPNYNQLGFTRSGNTVYIEQNKYGEYRRTNVFLWPRHMSLFSTFTAETNDEQDALRAVWDRMKRFH